ncbi:MAG: Gfo/Idh/MocA family oxidoreductase [Flavobacterium sp.]|nr:Gfo/Idh/MocA family oxidoreductase [Flavobacterium sp.]
MKLLLIGLGSIGQKHLSILSEMEGLELAALRTSKGLLKKEITIPTFYTLAEALAFRPDGVIIANPTALHAETALPFLEAGCKVLIEKPIDETVEKATILKPYASQIRVAYCMRFHPLIHYLKNKFSEEPPFKVGFKRSFYLPKWHPYADYTQEYTAQKKLGGGVIRTLSHELDLAIHWFGEPETVVGVTDKVSFLSLDTDDYAFFTLKTKQQARVNFELDFFSPVNCNTGEAFTAKGMYQWTLNEVRFMAYDTTEFIFLATFEDSVHKMYANQLHDFCNFVKTGTSINSTYQESISILNVIKDIEK